jgi:hypothetical protein
MYLNSTGFAWRSLLHTDAPRASSLQVALFTTYDRADERLLVEHLLPMFLKLNREPDGEGMERQYFLLELDRRLKQLHDRLIIVSSTTREEPQDEEESQSGTYEWIWRSIRHFTVGSTGKAVQHAKLWLLHWRDEADGYECLEIVVSSTNLTRSAFKSQLQGAWRTCLTLRPQPSQKRLANWGVLPAFLRELAASAGDKKRLDEFVTLLSRADCPEGITFVASVPGTHSPKTLRQTPWGAAGLKEIAPFGRGKVHVSILAPFVGSWNARDIRHWCSRFGGTPDRIRMVWIDKNHPGTAKWLLPEATLKTLTELDATILRLRNEPGNLDQTELFHEEQRLSDDRWSHAKVYSITRGTSRRLLVTSANFSAAAWGRQSDDGALVMENFELGVCIEGATWPFNELESFVGPHSVATVPKLPIRSSGIITWAQAAWDGKKVRVACRCQPDSEIDGTLKSAKGLSSIAKWIDSGDGWFRSAVIPWKDSTQPPLLVNLMCKHQSLSVPIFDVRPLRERGNTLPPEVDEDAAQIMRDELLFEQYGGHIAADDDGTPNNTISDDDELPETQDAPGPTDPDSYSVPAFALARRHLAIVDNWANQVKSTSTERTREFERELLIRDGELLIEAFRRQASRDARQGDVSAIGARLAMEELTLRLNIFRKRDATN